MVSAITGSGVRHGRITQLFRGNENALQLFLEKFWQTEASFERVHQALERLSADVESMKDDVSSLQSDVSNIESAVDEIKNNLE